MEIFYYAFYLFVQHWLFVIMKSVKCNLFIQMVWDVIWANTLIHVVNEFILSLYLQVQYYSYLFPDVVTVMKERKESLKSGECTIVIAGEVGAGKTSLLNLILETQIFPTDPLKCTNTIVEIRSSDKKEAIFYCKPKLSSHGKKVKIPPRIINLGMFKFMSTIIVFTKCRNTTFHSFFRYNFNNCRPSWFRQCF